MRAGAPTADRWGMVLLTQRKPMPDRSQPQTPYKDLLLGLAAVGDHDAEMFEFLMGMVRCIESGNYGTLRLLHRLLPMRDRKALGQPPASREDDLAAADAVRPPWFPG